MQKLYYGKIILQEHQDRNMVGEKENVFDLLQRLYKQRRKKNGKYYIMATVTAMEIIAI